MAGCPPFCVAGPKAPQDVDIYMAPLLESLLNFWRGIWTCDVSRPLSDPTRYFLLRVIVLWTIHDWPGLGSCSGLKTSGYAACHKCGGGLHGRRSETLKKVVYHEHRCWLDEDDPIRENRRHWGTRERRPRPIGPTPEEWKERWDKVQNKEISATDAGINRYSVFYTLPYWGVRP